MSIEKERNAFEEWYEKHHNGRQISCDYVYEDNSYSIGYANAMWVSWQAAKAKAVPDGYCIVPKEPTPKMIDATWDYDGEIQEMSHNTRNEVIYKAMIGACDDH